jgi:hypothetical protein
VRGAARRATAPLGRLPAATGLAGTWYDHFIGSWRPSTYPLGLNARPNARINSGREGLPHRYHAADCYRSWRACSTRCSGFVGRGIGAGGLRLGLVLGHIALGVGLVLLGPTPRSRGAARP